MNQGEAILKTVLTQAQHQQSEERRSQSRHADYMLLQRNNRRESFSTLKSIADKSLTKAKSVVKMGKNGATGNSNRQKKEAASRSFIAKAGGVSNEHRNQLLKNAWEEQ